MEKAYLTFYSRPGAALTRLVLTGERTSASERAPAQSYDFKLQESLSRTKAIAKELRFCNHWDYFCTLTISPDKADRYNWNSCVKRISNFFNNFKKRYAPNFLYLLVPESHIDGAIHCHRLLSGIPDDCLYAPELIPKRVDYNIVDGRKVGGRIEWVPNTPGYLSWDNYKLGWCSLERIRNQDRCSSYILKYITKSVQCEFGGESFLSKGDRILRASKGLNRAKKIDFDVDIKNTDFYSELCDFLGKPLVFDFCDIFQDLDAEQLNFVVDLLEKYKFI